MSRHNTGKKGKIGDRAARAEQSVQKVALPSAQPPLDCVRGELAFCVVLSTGWHSGSLVLSVPPARMSRHVKDETWRPGRAEAAETGRDDDDDDDEVRPPAPAPVLCSSSAADARSGGAPVGFQERRWRCFAHAAAGRPYRLLREGDGRDGRHHRLQNLLLAAGCARAGVARDKACALLPPSCQSLPRARRR